MRNLLLAGMACAAMLIAAGSANADQAATVTCGKNNSNFYADASSLTHSANWGAIVSIDCGHNAWYEWEIQIQNTNGTWTDLWDESEFYMGAAGYAHDETFHVGGIGCDNTKNYRLKAYDYWGGSWAAWVGGC